MLIKVDSWKLTQKCGADVLGDLIAGLAGLGEVAQLLIQHALELQVQHIHRAGHRHSSTPQPPGRRETNALSLGAHAHFTTQNNKTSNTKIKNC